MKRFFFSSGACVAVMSLCLFIPFSSHAQQAGAVRAESASICTGVANLQAVNAGSSFPASVGKLYCFSKIADIQEPTEIVHAWYYGNTERSRLSLEVKPPTWRTYSYKTIQAHETGSWRVEILDASGNLLETAQFEITR